MNAKQTKLIEQAATVETDGEGWRLRMEAWLDQPAQHGWLDKAFVLSLIRLAYK